MREVVVGTVVVRRPLRRPAPDMPAGELVLEAPPEIPAPSGRQWTQALMALPMVLMMGAMILLFSGSFGAGNGYMTVRYVAFGMFGVAMLAMVGVGFLNGGGPSKREMGHARRLYLRGLAQHRVRVGRTARRQRTALWYLHPDPNTLWSVAASYRLWERRAMDADFGVARIGLGRQTLATTLIAPDTKPLEQLEPLSALALRRFITTYSELPNLPLAMAVNGFARVHIRGNERAYGLVRAMIAQLVTLQSPDDLRIAVCVSPQRRGEWEWLKWLPHALHPERTDALGPLRLVAPAITMLEAMLEDLLGSRPRFDPDEGGRVSGPHLVVVVDGGETAGSDHLMAGAGVEGATVIDLTSVPPRAPDRSAVVLHVADDGGLSSSTADGDIDLGRADGLGVPAVEALARQLAPLRLTEGPRGEQPLSAELGLEELLELGDPYGFDPVDTWVPRPNRDRLRVKFGIQADGTAIELDLKESALDGMGPHGLLIGATGSGKSELLRTLVLALAVTHPPNSLNFALVDFKGGATFARLDKLPHTSAVITNLADELPLVDRMADAINGELLRRQELLRAAGNFASLRDYEKARAAGAPLAEVPTLFVVCDEFSELLTARPDFIDIFVQIGRIGRALGVHLLLASQRLEEGRLRGLDAHLSYRIGLRTFSEMDSRSVLGVSDAFSLPRAPGHGFLRYGDEPMMRFRSAYVSGVHRPNEPHGRPQDGQEPLGLKVYSTAYVAPEVTEEPTDNAVPDEVDDDAVGESLLDILVDRFAGRGVSAHQVWLPPLDVPPTMDQLLGDLVADPVRGLRPSDPAHVGALHAVFGIVDRPLDQRRDALVMDLSGPAGHAVVTGGPQSGKSTALRSIITSLALTNTPRDVQFYCLDFGGGSLGSLRDLPHVGGVAGRQATGAVRRTIAEVNAVLAERERRFAELEVDNMATYRALRASGRVDDPHGDVFLVIDGWLTLREDFEELERVVTTIAARGLAYGVHLIVTTARWFDLRMQIRDLFGSRLELRLGDPIDTAIDRAGALLVPENTPGRGLASSKHQALTALPRLDGAGTANDLSDGVAGLVAAVRAGWQGEPAPAVRLLPGTMPYSALPPRDDPAGRALAVGISELDLEPLRLDFAADAHLILFGDRESGKTTFVRTLARRVVESYSPEEARVIVVDYRRSLLGEVPESHLVGYGTDPAKTAGLMQTTAAAMKERLPGPDVTPEQLRRRSWWTGPELFVLVDDYDLVATAGSNPLLPIAEYLAQGRDIGLHLVITRRMGGAGRAMYEPFLTRMRDVGSIGLMLSGDKAEGRLFGDRKPEVLPPGRGVLVTRRGEPQTVQLAWLPPADERDSTV